MPYTTESWKHDANMTRDLTRYRHGGSCPWIAQRAQGNSRRMHRCLIANRGQPAGCHQTLHCGGRCRTEALKHPSPRAYTIAQTPAPHTPAQTAQFLKQQILIQVHDSCYSCSCRTCSSMQQVACRRRYDSHHQTLCLAK